MGRELLTWIKPGAPWPRKHQLVAAAARAKVARIGFVGDLMLGRLVSEQLRHGRTPESCWGDIGPLMRQADGVIANLECAITTHAQPWHRTAKVFHFGADPKAIDVLRAGNIRAVSLANNHILDFETAGLFDTLDTLDRAGIVHAGADRSEAEVFAPAAVRIGGVEIALFSVTDNEPPFAARGGEAGTAYLDPSDRASAARPSAAEIVRARANGAEFVVLSCHMGPNMVLEPSRTIRSYRTDAVARGIDIVHGHSAHVVQGVERIGHSLVLHDTGDFLDDYAVDPILHNDWSFIFFLETDARGLRRLNLVPVMLELAQVRRARPDEAGPICARMIAQSAKFGTDFAQTAEGLELVLQA